MNNLVWRLKSYAKDYRLPPLGRAVEGTPELLEEAADALQEADNTIAEFQHKYVHGYKVQYGGNDADDSIKCPLCGYEIARNDDFDMEKTPHCPQCGIKLIY